MVPFTARGATNLMAWVITQRVFKDRPPGHLVTVNSNNAATGGTIGSGESAKAAADACMLLHTPFYRKKRWLN